MNYIYYHDYDDTTEYSGIWKEYIERYLADSNTFELHIWNEETDLIEFALKYGSIKNDNWMSGKIIIGEVTDEFKSMILSTSGYSYDGVYNKLTPFFGIFLDDIFESAHYGTEIYYK